MPEIDPVFPAWELLWDDSDKTVVPDSPLYRHRVMGVFIRELPADKGRTFEVTGGACDGAKFPTFAVAALAVSRIP